MASSPSPDNFFTGRFFWKTLFAFGLVHLYLIFIPLNTQSPQLFIIRWASTSSPSSSKSPITSRTNLSHMAFGVMGSVQTWPGRRNYLESWWRPNITRGYVYLDKPPPPKFLPWPQTAPPYRVVDNISGIFRQKPPRHPVVPRIVHGILELFREEEHEELRWIVMGDDDSICFVDNIVDVLAEYDHTKYWYLGGHSESLVSNYWYSFNQAFGGGGIVLSYPLAKALAEDMEGCLVRYADGKSSDLITMACVNDIGVNLTPHKGIHQVDLHGDFSGYLSAHPKVPLMTFHHFDTVDPIFPNMTAHQSTRHLMKAADADQSRLMQQTICYHGHANWSFSVAWGYSAQIYERIMPRSYLQTPIETFKEWIKVSRGPPFYMFNTRPLSDDPCEEPHVFFLKSVNKSVSDGEIVTTYVRARNRANLAACGLGGNHSANSISRIQVFSPAEKRLQVDRCECCDIVKVDDTNVDLKFRECKIAEIIA